MPTAGPGVPTVITEVIVAGEARDTLAVTEDAANGTVVDEEYGAACDGAVVLPAAVNGGGRCGRLTLRVLLLLLLFVVLLLRMLEDNGVVPRPRCGVEGAATFEVGSMTVLGMMSRGPGATVLVLALGGA